MPARCRDRWTGREREIRDIADRIRLGVVRLLTLTGAGGVGKTRLAIDAAHQLQPDFADGARFVSLAALRGPDDVPAAVAHALHIVPLPGETAPDSVTRYLRAKQLLLVLDNFEHLLVAAPFVAELLSACPALTVLATSREPLNLAGEQRYIVAPLAFPPPGTQLDAIGHAPAVELFADRARRHDPDFEITSATATPVAEICRRVDGLPLAVELAAARCALLSPAEIATRLDSALTVLGHGPRDAPARQQTLRATIDWSYGLLPDDERTCFARCAVFAGGATIDAAEAVTGAPLDMLDGLVTKSLLARRKPPLAPTRLLMLETIRAHAHERLAGSAEHDAVREHHCRYYLAFLERHGSDRALCGAQRNDHLAQLDAEVENVHAALRWARDSRDAETALGLIAPYGEYCLMRGRLREALEWIDEALALPAPPGRQDLRIPVLVTKSWIARWVLPAEQAAAITEAEALARALGDPVLLAPVLSTRAKFESFANDLDACETSAQEAMRLATEADNGWEMAHASEALAVAAKTPAQLRERTERAAALLNRVGNIHHGAALYTSAAYVALLMGSDLDAKDYADQAAALGSELNDPYTTMIVRGNVGLASLLTGDADAAEQAFRDELEHCRQLVTPGIAAEGLLGLAAVAVARGNLPRAAQLVGAAVATPGELDPQLEARLDQTFFDRARARHGVDAWEEDVRGGAALGFDEAIAFALEESAIEA